MAGVLDAAWNSITGPMFSMLGGGEQVTLTRPNSLKDVKASAPARVFVATAPAAAGETNLTLRLSGSTPLYGELRAGTKIVVGGQALTLVADAEIAAQGVINLPVTFSPALVNPVAAGDPVTVSDQAEFTFRDVHVSYKSASALDGGGALVVGRSKRLALQVAGAPTTPKTGDGVVFADGSRGRLAAELEATAQWWDFAVGT